MGKLAMAMAWWPLIGENADDTLIQRDGLLVGG